MFYQIDDTESCTRPGKEYSDQRKTKSGQPHQKIHELHINTVSVTHQCMLCGVSWGNRGGEVYDNVQIWKLCRILKFTSFFVLVLPFQPICSQYPPGVKLRMCENSVDEKCKLPYDIWYRMYCLFPFSGNILMICFDECHIWTWDSWLVWFYCVSIIQVRPD